MTEANVGEAIMAHARERLQNDYLPKLMDCLNRLSEEETWWRPHPTSNSVGNLLLHLSGNLRQWIVHGIGGEANHRVRQQEFDERGPMAKAELVRKLERTLDEVYQVLERFDRRLLLEPRTIQGYETNALFAVIHVVEHFAQHLGQILYITKMLKAVDLRHFVFDEHGYRIRE